MKKSKVYFPYCAEMSAKPDLNILLDSLSRWSDRWEDSFSAHGKSLTSTNGELAKATIGNIEHISLTGPKEEAADESNVETYRNSSYRQIMRWEGAANEKNWGEPRDFFLNSPLHKHIQELFKEKPIRLRLSKMKPGFELPAHIDYGTQYAIRFIIPIKGNEGVINKFHVKDKTYSYEMENGKCYFLNIGYKHSVSHQGSNDRYYLIGSLDGQEDVKNLCKQL